MNMIKLSLYDRLGGEPTIDAIVNALYDRVLADAELMHFFEQTSMEKQRRIQHEFLCAALGGPMSYTGQPLAHVHHGRGITTQHFARFVQHCLNTLQELDISEEDTDEVISRLNAFANEITGTSY